MEIILKFDKNIIANKECPEDIDIVKEVCWVVNCAMAAIEENYPKNSVRYIEMQSLCRDMLKQIKSQITEDQYEECHKFFRI